MQTKKCIKCGTIKAINEFYKDKIRKDGIHCYCKTCCNKHAKSYRAKDDIKKYEKNRHKVYYKENKQKLLEYRKQWQKDNKEHIKQYHKNRIEITRKYNKDNTEKIKLNLRKFYKRNPYYRKLRYRNIISKDIKCRLNHALSGGMANSLRDGKNGKSWEKIIGYTLRDLMNHLEQLFKAGMSFDNYGKWHIDHIIPRSLWKFKSYNCKEFKQCWALANLQPLWAFDNLSKGNRI